MVTSIFVFCGGLMIGFASGKEIEKQNVLVNSKLKECIQTESKIRQLSSVSIMCIELANASKKQREELGIGENELNRCKEVMADGDKFIDHDFQSDVETTD